MRRGTSPYETTTQRIGAALLAGSLAGGVALAGLHYAFGVSPSLRGFLIDLEYGSAGSALLLALASPAWVFLHRRNYRTWYVAALLGVGMTLALWLLASVINVGVAVVATRAAWWPDASDLQYALKDTLLRLSLFAAVGGTMGFVVWRTAYRRG